MTSILDQLAELEKAATAGEWFSSDKAVYSGGDEANEVASTKWSDRPCQNAEFIAAMRNHAKALIEVARAAKEWLKADDEFGELVEAADRSNWHPNYSDEAWHKANMARDKLRAALKDIDWAVEKDPK